VLLLTMTNNDQPSLVPKGEELFPLVNENDEVIGQIIRKEANFNKAYIHRAVGLIIKDRQANYLIQKRSPYKDKYPNLLTLSVSGHVDYGDSYIQTMIREAQEEIGLDLEKGEIKFLFKKIYPSEVETEIWSVYELEVDEIDLNDYKFDTKEVSELILMSKAELVQKLEATPGNFSPKAELVLKDVFTPDVKDVLEDYLNLPE
jgi:isopentenyl-diphosphate delta-isomerase